MEISDKAIVKKWSSLENSAKSRDIPFDISIAKMRQLLAAEKCFYTGLEFNDSVEELKRSIDRVESDRGYVDDNVVPCIKRINELKTNLSYRELIWIFKGLERHYKKHGKKLSDIKNTPTQYEITSQKLQDFIKPQKPAEIGEVSSVNYIDAQ